DSLAIDDGLDGLRNIADVVGRPLVSVLEHAAHTGPALSFLLPASAPALVASCARALLVHLGIQRAGSRRTLATTQRTSTCRRNCLADIAGQLSLECHDVAAGAHHIAAAVNNRKVHAQVVGHL